MPLDAVCLRAVVDELAPQLTGARIEKIQQPARDQVVLLLRGSRRLLLCANPNQPRIHMTEKLRDNPSQPPMFCMLLRKRIGNGRIVSIEQAPLERVVTLHIEATDELGEQSRFALILEALGRHANLILCDKEGRILDCLRRVDLEMSQERQVLPGLFYHLPPRQNKRDPLTVTREEFAALLPREETPLDGWLLDTFTAMPPLVAREIVSRQPPVGQLCRVARAGQRRCVYAYSAVPQWEALRFYLWPYQSIRRLLRQRDRRQLQRTAGQLL